MVAGGFATGDYTRSVEIIDLETSSSTCQNFPNYPQRIRSFGGGATLRDGSPLICGGATRGGTEDTNECLNYVNNEWRAFYNLTEAKHYVQVTKSPFLQEDYDLIVVGGDRGLFYESNVTEVLTSDGWKSDILPELPNDSVVLCALWRDSKTVIAMGATTSFLMSDDFIWREGPSMIGVLTFSCARILTDAGSDEFSIIAPIGVTVDYVQVLDPGSSEWRYGPTLPFEIGRATVVEDPLGGVILIGGENHQGKRNSAFLKVWSRFYLCILFLRVH
jgi:hypothetical protein